MDSHKLEAPSSYNSTGWDELYAARGADVPAGRPIFTGDVFTGVSVEGDQGDRVITCAVLQHPCSLRTDGVTLVERALVAEVVVRRVPNVKNWDGHFSIMPVPRLGEEADSEVKTDAGFELGTCINFDALHVVRTSALTERVACLSLFGVNLLMQRWTKYMTRTTVPTSAIALHTRPVYDEADLCQEWCDQMEATSPTRLDEEMRLFQQWLRAPQDDAQPNSVRLQEAGKVAPVRMAMRKHLRSRPNGGSSGTSKG